MTTVVCDLNGMASDSKASGDMVLAVAKIWRIRGGLLGAAGEVVKIYAFVRWFRGGCKGPLPDMAEVEAIYLNRGHITYFDASPYGYAVDNERMAIGSGAHFALGAMAMGANLRTAVKVAAAFDPWTGGRIINKVL